MRTYIILIASTLMASAQPAMTLVGLENDGVSLLGLRSPEFIAALDARRDTKADVLLPYSVLVSNRSKLGIIAYSLTWRCHDGSGKIVPHNITRWDFRALNVGLGPGRSKLFSIVRGVGTPSTEPDERIRTIAGFYERQESIEVQLDLAVFADGRAAGPDPDHWLPRLRAWMEAERDLQSGVAGLRRPEDVEAFVLSAARSVDLSDPGKATADLARRVNTARSFGEAYGLARTYFAAWMALGAQKSGYGAVLEQVRQNMTSRRYPVIHREEN